MGNAIHSRAAHAYRDIVNKACKTPEADMDSRRVRCIFRMPISASCKVAALAMPICASCKVAALATEQVHPEAANSLRACALILVAAENSPAFMPAVPTPSEVEAVATRARLRPLPCAEIIGAAMRTAASEGWTYGSVRCADLTDAQFADVGELLRDHGWRAERDAGFPFVRWRKLPPVSTQPLPPPGPVKYRSAGYALPMVQ